ncbi:receptor ligand binding region family protein [Anoxybacillus sp. B7M1]|uniref:ABC transporter substrate-binding protein n=1 Tax=unclassified Anoxybacillus TaxID=2639704 RepID=UPI0007B5A9E0|nr:MULTISPECIES: ABC transporter substrate-binding protein [unclassified Anoxybacillus]ANB56507.1 receptor ligand binding region family protein [Anoxybacillus sp. B2M1]ANB66031.1 receptor ligand binding region family protein [Anoxybacillus sp. B7M1]
MMKKRFLLIFVLSVFLFIAACSSKEENSGQGNKKASEYVIGAIYSKTGPNSPLGEPEWNATQLIVDKINAEGGINGVPIRLILADDESNQEKATQEMNRLVHDEQALVVLGSSGSGESLAMKGIAMQNQVPMISAGASVHIIDPVQESKWVFKTPHSDVHAVQRIYEYLNKQGINRIGTLTDSNSFGTSGLEQLEKLASKYDIEITEKESYNTQDPDMSAQLTRIKSSGAQAVVVWGTNPGPAVIASNMKKLNMAIPMIGSHGIANQNFINLAKDAAEGVVIPTGKLLFPEQIPKDDAQYEVITSFHKAYVEKYGNEPTNFGAYGHDNIMLVIEALRSGANDRESIRDFLENKVKNWVGATGMFTFSPDDHNGLTSDSMVMAVVKDGKWTLLEN